MNAERTPNELGRVAEIIIMTDIWNRLISHRRAQGDLRIEALFDADAARADTCSTAADGLVLDWSKTSIDDGAMALLLDLAQPVAARRDAMFGRTRINETEDRAVLHTALRNLEARSSSMAAT